MQLSVGSSQMALGRGQGAGLRVLQHCRGRRSASMTAHAIQIAGMVHYYCESHLDACQALCSPTGTAGWHAGCPALTQTPHHRCAEHAAYVSEVAVASCPKRLPALLKVLEAQGHSLLSPSDRNGLHPLLIPLSTFSAGGECCASPRLALSISASAHAASHRIA